MCPAVLLSLNEAMPRLCPPPQIKMPCLSPSAGRLEVAGNTTRLV